MDEAVRRLQTVFGIVAVTKSCVVEKDCSVICPAAAEYFAEQLTAARTFKVEAKRSDKAFPMKSPEISRELGGYLLSRFHHLKVKVEQPEITITVEIREQGAYIHANQLPGAGGIPVGTGGRAMLLLSGGIDSPVAGYMMAKRGLEIAAVHFASPPYASDRARQKVLDSLAMLEQGYIDALTAIAGDMDALSYAWKARLTAVLDSGKAALHAAATPALEDIDDYGVLEDKLATGKQALSDIFADVSARLTALAQGRPGDTAGGGRRRRGGARILRLPGHPELLLLWLRRRRRCHYLYEKDQQHRLPGGR